MTALDRILLYLKKPWFIGLVLALVMVAYLFLDKPLALYARQLDLQSSVLLLFSALGKWMLYVLLFSLAVLYFRYIAKNKRYERVAWYFLACVASANLVCSILKLIFGRARPELLFNHHEYGFYWFKMNNAYWSFPSGHAMTVAALALAIGLLVPRYFFIALVAALLIALTRVLLCMHYLSDVVLGFYLSLLIVSVVGNLPFIAVKGTCNKDK